MLRKIIYPKIDSGIKKMASFLHEQEITPNQLTISGTILSFLAGAIFAKGYFFLAGIVLMVGGLGDLLDGPLARISNNTSKFGAFLDSTLDRYSDFFLFGGLALFYAKNNSFFWLFVVLGSLLGSFAVSYSKARSENFIEDCSVGIFARAERVLLLALGAFVPILMKPVLIILFLGTNFTAIQRILHTKKQLSQKKEITSE